MLGKKHFIYGCEDERVRINKIPRVVLEEFKKLVSKVNLWIINPHYNEREQPNCVKYLMGEDFAKLKEGRKRATFILASYFKRAGLTEEDIYNKITAWNSLKLNNYLKLGYIRSTTKSAKGLITCKYITHFLQEIGFTSHGLHKLCGGCKHKRYKPMPAISNYRETKWGEGYGLGGENHGN